MSARRAAFERIESALGDSVRRVGGVGGVDLGFRPDPGVDLWIPVKVANPIKASGQTRTLNVHQELDEHVIVIVSGIDVSYVSSKKRALIRPDLEKLQPGVTTWTGLGECIGHFNCLARSWEGMELMSPLHRKRREKQALKCVAETSAVNKTIRRVFEEQGFGKHLLTVGGRCGADFAFFPDPGSMRA